MHMISAHNSSQNLNLQLLTYLTDQIAHSTGKIAFQHMVAILRNPHKMILYFILRMTSVAVFHRKFVKQLLAESYPAKAGGFNL